jgi:biopolymer transport protein ExbD
MILRARITKTIGLNLTSMIDVVFLLLVYFMVATEFKTAEESYPMDLPLRQGGQVVLLDNEPLVILIETLGPGLQDISIRLEGPWEPVASLQGLSAFLRANQVSSISMGGLFASSHPIRIRPSENTRWEHAVSAYNVVVDANYTNITLDDPS